MNGYAVQMKHITKRFPGLIANNDITLEVKQGTVHALLGENGAGKSTLMSILFGLIQADKGDIFINGQKVRITNPNHATALGIGMVHQHFKLIPSYTVTENIMLGLEPLTRYGHIEYDKAGRRVAELSERYGLNIDPHAKIRDITVGMQQRVEILKTLYREAEIIVLDEPTAVLTPQEIDELLDIIRALQNENKTIIFITHKLKEIAAAAQTVTVIRRGKVIDTVTVAGTDEHKLAELMVGRPVKLQIEKEKPKSGDEVLRIENLYVRNARGHMALNDLNLTIRSGEITGIAGVDGNGQSELIAALYGLIPAVSGAIFYNGKEITHETTQRRIYDGIALSPEDRQREGLILDFRLDENLILKHYNRPPFCNKWGFLQFEAMRRNAERLIGDFDVRSANGYKSLARELSGGNQQKLLLAREINSKPSLLIICQPTRGLDVGSIEYIHKRIVAERDAGVAVLLISFELEEIIGLCDRIAAISHGHIAAVLNADEADSRTIGALMAGVKNKETMHAESKT